MSTPRQQQSSKLQALNYSNIAAYILNAAVTYGVGLSGFFPTNAELSAKYQTIVTPAGYAFSIWGIVFLSEAIFTVAQALPAYRSSDVVVKGVGYYYVMACIAQSAWSFLFAKEIITGSLAAMLSILLALVLLVRNLQVVTLGAWWQWAVFKFPFQIHCGWIWAASFVNANVLLVSMDLGASIQVIAAWVSLGLLGLVAAYYLLAKKNYVVPSVVAWASYAVRVELNAPLDSIAETFDAETITIVSQSAMALAIVVLVSTVSFGAYQFYQQRKLGATPNRNASTHGVSEIPYGTMNN